MSLGHGHASELDVERVGAGHARRVHEAHGAVAVVDDVDVDVAADVAADAARDVALPRLGRVDGDDALLADRDGRGDAI